MLSLPRRLWNMISYIGISQDPDNPDRKNIILGNQVVTMLCIGLIVFAAALMYEGIYRAAFLVANMVLVFGVFTYLIYKGYFFIGRLLGITVQNFSIFIFAIFLGEESRIIDFLFLSSLMPLVLFNIKERGAIAFCIAQNFLLYIIFHLFKSQYAAFALPPEQQLIIYNISIPLKFMIVLLVVYIIIKKRNTEEKEQQDMIEELERVNEGLKQFAYVTSHDLKTPLRNISTYLQLLKRKNKLDDESNEMIDGAVQSVKHLNQLIQDIFLYTATDFKNAACETIDTAHLLKTLHREFQHNTPGKNIDICYPPDIPPVKLNAVHAQHLFANLLSNGIKYNHSAAPRIEITYNKGVGFTEFRVSDNGIGIEPRHQQQIFDIFRRLHSLDEFEGTGIGLALCKKITESYGGTIQLQSVPGSGTTFILTLPH